ncbi:MAG TPA: hypothetical protein VK578_06785 [Edaphobacter sp.]|nr:hypothetical protein [Edaphobacter sp.]
MLIRSRFFAVCAFSAVLFAFTVPFAQAQKPALTKSVDEPGRSPYFDQGKGTCDQLCFVTFKAVPAGFRLVVTHASVVFYSFAGSEKFVFLQQNPLTYQQFLPAPGLTGGFDGTAYSYVASSPVTFYVEAGATPQLGVNRTALNSSAFGSISGYLVAIP